MDAAAKYLVDTNVLIYAYDAADPGKRDRAIELLTHLASRGSGLLSVQILSEYNTNKTRKPAVPLTREQARDSCTRLSRSWTVLDLTVRTFLEATRGVVEHRLSFWDALVWATALQEHVNAILTEDQQHQRVIEGVRYLNPFDAGFRLDSLS